MTREDKVALSILKAWVEHDKQMEYADRLENIEVYSRAIRALEQQSCDDCISREEAIRIAEQGQIQGYEWQFKKLCTLPSVTPKYTDEEIQKIQELEQAQLDKAYELGKIDSFEEWLASFNTESATCCFTAVQELKNRLEGENND